MAELEQLGTEQNRSVYRRHGAGESVFGVSFADLHALARRIGTDQQLAADLWATGNADARALATMVADPAAFSSRELDRWLESLDDYLLVDLISGLAAKTPFVYEKAETWSAAAARSDWLGQAGWNLVGYLARSAPELSDSYFEQKLATIETSIGAAPNRTRHAMNGALIAIGARNSVLRRQALAAATRIGEVEVDHGQTGCKTPDAGPYIERIWDRREAKAPSAS
jgi:3-methyladenine DNA glycosylase AlkD